MAESPLSQSTTDDLFDLRASYKFPLPDLVSPESSRMTNPGLEEARGVKRPTILEVTRKPQSDEAALHERPRVERLEKVKEIVTSAGAAHGIDPALGIAVARAESSFDPNAISRDGHQSKGLFQLLDTTAQTIISRDKLDLEYAPFEPQQNVDLGMRYLRYLHEIFGKESPLPNELMTREAANSSSLEKLAVAAYNAGEGRVASAQARAAARGANPGEYEQIANYLPKSTQEYVERVMQFRLEYGGEE